MLNQRDLQGIADRWVLYHPYKIQYHPEAPADMVDLFNEVMVSRQLLGMTEDDTLDMLEVKALHDGGDQTLRLIDDTIQAVYRDGFNLAIDQVLLLLSFSETPIKDELVERIKRLGVDD